jgi:putative transcriptional regulator
MAGLTNRVRELRAGAGVTQQQLADRIGLTRQTVIAIEGDKYSPSLETAFRITRVFGVGLEEVFGDEGGGRGRGWGRGVGSRGWGGNAGVLRCARG